MDRGLVSNYAEQIRGVSYKPNDLHDGLDKDAVILLRANNIDDGKINFDDVVYVDRKKVSKSQYLQKGDILICASSGSKNLVGKAASVDFDTECTFGAFCKVVRPTKVTPEFLGLFFQSPSYRRKISALAQGANINNIKNEHIDNLQLAIYSEREQRQIIERLTRAITIIHARKDELSKLDELIKARFVEMFGDQGDNPLGFEVETLKDVADIYLGLTHTPTYVDSGRPFLSVRDISSGTIDFSNCHYITEEEFQSLPKGARPMANDLLFCRVGTIGKPVIVPEGIPEFGSFVSVGFLRKKENVLNEYLKSWMEDPFFMKQVYDNVAGASQINLNTGWLKNFRIIVPPLDLQKQFAAFVEQVDKSKVAVQKALNEAQILFDSLMQECFG